MSQEALCIEIVNSVTGCPAKRFLTLLSFLGLKYTFLYREKDNLLKNEWTSENGKKIDHILFRWDSIKIFLNAFWLALVASFGSYKSIELLRSSSIKLNSTELDAEITVTFSDERINLNFRTLYLKCLVLVLLLSFCMSTYWLLYFLNPAQKIKSKTFISIMITTNGSKNNYLQTQYRDSNTIIV